MEEASNIDMEEVKRLLRGAGLFEPNMLKEHMMVYYKALKNSESTASFEDQSRKLKNNQEILKKLLDDDSKGSAGTSQQESVSSSSGQHNEKSFLPKSWISERKHTTNSSLEHDNNKNSVLNNDTNDTPKDATKTVFGFNEMEKDAEQTLAIICHKLKFVSIQNSKKFLSVNVALKAKMLYTYHTKLNKTKTEIAKLSFYPAPLPKVISIMDTYSNLSDIDTPDTYTCRSGRQIKRKIYNYDDEDSMEAINIKKVKNSEDQDWLNNSSSSKNQLRAPKKQEANKVSSELNKSDNDSQKEKKSINKKETRTPSAKTLSNIEIMKRSRLFSATPKRRSESLFDKLKEEEEKKEREEKTIESFKKTLDRQDDETDRLTDNEDIITVDDEDAFRIRVIPPIPKLSKVNRKRNISENFLPLDVTVTPVNQNNENTAEHNGVSQEKSEIKKTYVKRRPAIHRTVSKDAVESVASTSQTSTASTSKNVECPICNNSFKEDQIVNHAATCGEVPSSPSNSKFSRITCEICDKVVEYTTDYEVHVKECIAKRKEAKDNN